MSDLAIAIGIIALLKIADCKMRRSILEAVAVFLLVAVTLMTFLQGKIGGGVVYDHGMAYLNHIMIEKTLQKASVEIEETVGLYKDAIDEIDFLSEKVDKTY